MASCVTPYMHRGGREGRDRLAVLAGVVAPTTTRLFDRLGDLDGQTVVDVGCGGGDVAFQLARRVGPSGRVLGLDLDETQLSIARAEAADRGLTNLSLEIADIQKPWPVEAAHVAYMRFVLTHMADPLLVLNHAFSALRPGGTLVVEDVDMAGHICDPASAAFERYYHYYLQAARLRGGDPSIGLKLDLLLAKAGFTNIEIVLVQPFGRVGDIKLIPQLTMAAMGDGLLATHLASQLEVDEIVSELKAFGLRPDTLVFMPRIFQVCGRRPDGVGTKAPKEAASSSLIAASPRPPAVK